MKYFNISAFILTLSMGMALAGNVSAFCSKPSMYNLAPSAPSISRPSPPYCLSGYKYSGTHTCDEWETQSYINEINNYISELSDYAQEAGNVPISVEKGEAGIAD
jgi:hypothetical protein